MHRYDVAVPGAALTFDFDSTTWARLVDAMTGAGMVKRSAVMPFHPPDLPGPVWRELLAASGVDLPVPLGVPCDPDLPDAAFVALIADVRARTDVGACPVDVTDGQWRTFEIWQIGDRIRRALHDASVPGIAAHKLTGSITWVVTPEECAGALAVWDGADTWAAAATIDAAGPRWDTWVEALDLGATYGGLTVRAHNPALTGQ